MIASRHVSLGHLPAVSGCAAARSACRRLPVGAKEGAQFFRVELGLLEWREMPAARGLGHAHDVRRALEPGPRRADDVAAEQREADGTSTRRVCWAGGIAAFAWYMRIDEPIVAVSQ